MVMELIKKLGTRKSKSGKYRLSYGLFLCSYCKKEVIKQLGGGKKFKSCGCVSYQLAGYTRTKHGDGGRFNRFALYCVWDSMIQRCCNSKSKAYKWYGGRGITVCNEWKEDYLTFKKWALENGWKKNLYIDRINNDGGYNFNNCRFVDRITNNRKQSNVKLSMERAREIRKKYKTGDYTHRRLGEEYGVGHSTIGSILRNITWKENVK